MDKWQVSSPSAPVGDPTSLQTPTLTPITEAYSFRRITSGVILVLGLRVAIETLALMFIHTHGEDGYLYYLKYPYFVGSIAAILIAIDFLRYGSNWAGRTLQVLIAAYWLLKFAISPLLGMFSLLPNAVLLVLLNLSLGKTVQVGKELPHYDSMANDAQQGSLRTKYLILGCLVTVLFVAGFPLFLTCVAWVMSGFTFGFLGPKDIAWNLGFRAFCVLWGLEACFSVMIFPNWLLSYGKKIAQRRAVLEWKFWMALAVAVMVLLIESYGGSSKLGVWTDYLDALHHVPKHYY